MLTPAACQGASVTHTHTQPSNRVTWVRGAAAWATTFSWCVRSTRWPYCRRTPSERREMLKAGVDDLDTSKTGDRCVLWRELLDAGKTDLAKPIDAYRGYWGKYTLA